MNCSVCGTPIRHRATSTCSKDCTAIRDSGLTPDEYWRQQCQVPDEGLADTRNQELEGEIVARAVMEGVGRDL